jgi:YD repeat-containing protein
VGTIDGRPTFITVAYTILGFNYAKTSQSPQLTSQVVSEEGDTYTRATPSTQFDPFGHPLQFVRSNSFGNSATSTFTYLNDTTNWVIGLPATRAVNGIVEEKELYTPLDQVQEVDRFGLLQYSYGYDSTGLLHTETDGLAHTTKFDYYFRGTPELVTFADTNAVGRTVNADGTIALITDELGHTTYYAYDSLSRLKTITYPSPDTVSWAPVSIAWQRVSTSPYGAAAMQQTINDGHLSKAIYYDPQLRPIFEKESDLTTGVTRYRRRAYDSAGRVTFQSYPSSAIATTGGVTTLYDPLGRTSKTSDTIGLLTSVNYLSGNRRSVTDGNGHSVTYTAQAYDEPGGDAITLISAPETQSTQIVRDVFGHVQSVTQSGTYLGSAVSAKRSYIYDSYYRPCKSIDPESGETALAFDAASNVVWQATGQTNSPTSCSPKSSTPNGTSYGYDPRNRLLSLTTPTGTESVGYTYYADGRTHTIVTPNSTWTYTYNGRGLLEQQTMVGGGRSFGITDAFDAQGHRSQRTSPSSRIISYAPDAWGNPSRLGTYATGVSYYPSGSVAAFTYGNGVTYAQSLDARLRPGNVKIAGTVAGNMIDVTYGYDPVGNVLSIADAGARGDSRTLTYDGLNRLATGSAGILGGLTFGYDPLNNLRSQTATTGRSVAGTYNATTNRIDGITGTYTRSFGYNTAGDLTSDGLNSYTSMRNIG